MSNRTIAVDFDGVIHPYTHGWIGSIPDIEPPTIETRQFLEWLHYKYRVVVFSTRAKDLEGHAGLVNWLANHDLIRFVADVTAEKPAAIAYIDDRAIAFDGSWEPVKRQIELMGRMTGGWPTIADTLPRAETRLHRIAGAILSGSPDRIQQLLLTDPIVRALVTIGRQQERAICHEHNPHWAEVDTRDL